MTERRMRVTKMRLAALWTALGCALLLTACTGSNSAMSPDLLSSLKAQGDGWTQLTEGDTKGGCEALWSEAASPSVLYGRAECSRLLGDYTRSATAYAELMQTAPASPWTTLAASRVPEVWQTANDMRSTGREACDAMRTAADATSWTRYQGALCAMTEARESWSESDVDGPFDGSAFGVPTVWRVVGPTSVRGNLDFDTVTAPEEDPVLAERYELLGFQRRAEWKTARGHLDLDAYSGIYVAETWIDLDRETRLDVVLDYPGLAALSIDGTEILRRDDRERSLPNTLLTRGVRLSAGAHRVTVRAAVERGYKRYVQVALVGGAWKSAPYESTPDGTYALAERLRGGATGKVLDAGTPGPFFDIDVTKLPADPAVLGGVAAYAVTIQDEWLARPAIARLTEVAPDWSGLSMLHHDLSASLWTVPAKIRRKDNLRHLREALEADPDQNMARLRLAVNLRNQQLKDATDKAIAELLSQGPEEAYNWAEAARYYSWRGFQAKTEAAWKRAAELDPQDCEAAREVYRALVARDATPAELTPVQERCEGTNWLHAKDVSRVRGKPGAYLRHLERDVTRFPDQAWRWRQWIKGVRAHEPDQLVAACEKALAWHPAEVELVSLVADIHAASGDVEKARAVLTTALADHSGSSGLHRQLALLDGDLPLRDLLADGGAAIREYERDEVKEGDLGASAIFVLDYMARRYFEDGTSADVTHLVVKVLAKEGLDEHGEISFPRGSVPLLLRTIKKSGRVIEPQPVRGKAKVSMVGLDVGDYVEYAYLSFSGRIPTERGAVLGANFYFKMSNIASAHSEFVVETPATWDPEFVAEHGAPVAEITENSGLRRHRYLRTGSIQQRAEPDAVANAEHLPHVQMIHKYTWEDVHTRRRDDLAGTATVTPLFEEAVRKVCEDNGAKTARQRAKVLFRWANFTVKSPRMADFETPAHAIHLTGEGNPAVLLRAALGVFDITAELILVRPHSADPRDTPIPSLGKYSIGVVKVTFDDGEDWLYAGGKHSPYGILPVVAQGATAVSIEPPAPFTKFETPRVDPELSRSQDEVEAALSPDGTLTGTLRVTRKAFSAAGRRDAFEQLGTEDKITKYLERDLNYVISGGEMTGYEIKGLDEIESPVVIEIQFRRPGYARVGANGELLVEDRYALPDLTRRHARLAERTVPMLLRRRDTRVRVKLTLPAGKTVVKEALPELDIASEYGRYTRAVKLEGQTLELVMELSMPTQRIPVEEYETFGAWAGDVDRGTYLRIEAR